ncbi:MAG: efflux RND transporter periplasmic adaptor subunit [Flavobacteriales bacterium]|jgi:multidrug efflux pump subunit AcrA (membrane-fusion protein)
MRNKFLLLFSMIIITACGSKSESVKPKRDRVVETVFASGALDANIRYQLTAQVDGYIKDINNVEGEDVLEGEIFAVIDNVSNSANSSAADKQLAIALSNLSDNAPAIKELTANIELAEAKKSQEERNVQRYRNLRATNSISALELENAELAFSTAVSNLNALKEKLKLIRQQALQTEISQRALKEVNESLYGYNKVRVPVAGTCIKIFKKNGDFVKKGDVIAEIADINSLVAKLNVDETVVRRVEIGQKALVSLNVSGENIENARVQKIYPLYDDASQSYICDLVFDSIPSFSLVGTRLEANIIVGEKDNALLVPRAYLSYANTIHVKGEDTPRPVKVGIKGTEWVEILEGLEGNEELIMHKK